MSATVGGNEFGDCLVPVRPFQGPKKQAIVYEGLLRMHVDAKQFEGYGQIYTQLLPEPRLKFWIDTSQAPVGLSLMGPTREPRTLEAIALGCSFPCMPVGMTNIGENDEIIPVRLIGLAARGVEVNPGASMDSLRFDVVNGPHAHLVQDTSGIVRVSDGELEVALRRVRSKHDQMPKDEDSADGYMITHTGLARRVDGASFASPVANDVLRDVGSLISLLTGRRTSPASPIGYLRGVQSWESWQHWVIDPESDVRSWRSPVIVEPIGDLFAAIRARGRDEMWSTAIGELLWWYASVLKREGGLSPTIVHCQVALDLLAWTWMVHEKHAMSEGALDRIGGADRLRVFLSLLGIPCEIPRTLHDLVLLAKDEHWADGPEALTQTRNAIVHPTKLKNRQQIKRVPGKALYESCILGTWYLELAMLHVLRHSGLYWNRTKKDLAAVERVPWANA